MICPLCGFARDTPEQRTNRHSRADNGEMAQPDVGSDAMLPLT
jgi:hypothetical protein